MAGPANSTDTAPRSGAGSGMARRAFLGAAAGVMGAAAVGSALPSGTAVAGPAQPPSPGPGGAVRAPFTLGVASGDPTPDGMVLWTRLAPMPLAEDGRGGMPDRPVPVQWEISEQPTFARAAARGTELVRPEEAHSVHVEVTGLRPGTDYFYRFRSGADLSPVGRTRTAPAVGSRLDRFAFAFASCQNYPAGFYTAYADMAKQDLDLVVHLGDYIYEGDGQGTIGRGWAPARETTTLADYRVRHGQVKTDPDLQAAHAAFPWAVTFDDHEVDNNWAGTDADPDVGVPEFLARRAQAFQAYYENMPLRRAQRPAGPDLRVYRRLTFGDLADLHLLDTRQYRSDQVPDAQRAAPGRTMLGDGQERWLNAAVAGPTARWNVLAQQMFFSRLDFDAGPGTNINEDAWDGYQVARDRLRDHLAVVRTSNPVVITGDVHVNYVCDVKANFDDPASATVATELVGTSISTGGDGIDQGPNDARLLATNPHIKFINRDRGYVRNVVTPTEWTADFQVVDYVTRPGSPVRTRASFVIEEGRPGARPS